MALGSVEDRSQAISLVPPIFIVNLVNLIFISFAGPPRDSIRFPSELQAASLPCFHKASHSLCSPAQTNRPTVQPSAELRAPVAWCQGPGPLAARSSSQPRFNLLHNTTCDFAPPNFHPFCVAVDVDCNLLYLPTFSVGFASICRNILSTKSTGPKVESGPVWRIGNRSIQFSAGRSEFFLRVLELSCRDHTRCNGAPTAIRQGSSRTSARPGPRSKVSSS